MCTAIVHASLAWNIIIYTVCVCFSVGVDCKVISLSSSGHEELEVRLEAGRSQQERYLRSPLQTCLPPLTWSGKTAANLYCHLLTDCWVFLALNLEKRKLILCSSQQGNSIMRWYTLCIGITFKQNAPLPLLWTLVHSWTLSVFIPANHLIPPSTGW